MVDAADVVGGWATLDLENSPAPSPLVEDEPPTTEGGPPADDEVAEVEDEEDAPVVCKVGLVPVSLIFRIQSGQNHLPLGLLPLDRPTQPRWNHSVEQLELSQPIISPYASFLQMHQGLSLPSTAAPPPAAAIALRSPRSPPTSAAAPEEEEEEEEGAPAPFPDAPLPPPPPPAAFELEPLLFDDEEEDAEFFDPPAPLGALRVGAAAAVA